MKKATAPDVPIEGLGKKKKEKEKKCVPDPKVADMRQEEAWGTGHGEYLGLLGRSGRQVNP